MKYHPKLVEKLTDLNKLYSVASCLIIIAILNTVVRRVPKLPKATISLVLCVPFNRLSLPAHGKIRLLLTDFHEVSYLNI